MFPFQFSVFCLLFAICSANYKSNLFAANEFQFLCSPLRCAIN